MYSYPLHLLMLSALTHTQYCPFPLFVSLCPYAHTCPYLVISSLYILYQYLEQLVHALSSISWSICFVRQLKQGVVTLCFWIKLNTITNLSWSIPNWFSCKTYYSNPSPSNPLVPFVLTTWAWTAQIGMKCASRCEGLRLLPLVLIISQKYLLGTLQANLLTTVQDFDDNVQVDTDKLYNEKMR